MATGTAATPTQLLIPLAIATLLACLFTWLAVRAWRKRRLISKTQTSPVEALAPGLVEVEGQARAVDGTLQAPISGAECLAYALKVERRDADGDDRDDWDTIHQEDEVAPFWVEDGTGRVQVDVGHADLELDLDEQRYTDDEVPEELSDRYGGVLEREGFLDKASAAVGGDWGSARYTEALLAPDDAVYVLGAATSRPSDPAGGPGLWISKDESAPRLIVSTKGEASLLKESRKALLGWGFGSLFMWFVVAMVVLGMLGVVTWTIS